MVEKYKTILNNLETDKGPITLLALLKMDDLVDKWSIIFSASWSNDDNRSEAFNAIKTQILINLDSQEISEIARIGIFPKDEHLVESLLNYQSGVELRDQKINGNYVHCAIIIKSDRNV
jgi:hypothetical protein